MNCKYKFKSTDPMFFGNYCFAYAHSNREDKKFWGHFPLCKEENCPLKYSELLERASLDTGEFVNCANCLYWDDCDNKESRDGCYFGEVIDETLD